MGVDLPRAGLLLLLLALPRSAASVPSSRTFIPTSSLRRGRDSLPTRVFNRRTGLALVAAAQDGRYQHSNSNSASAPTGAASTADLPASFDSRTAWPGCASIAAIYDQGACGDCWAVSSTMTATDRWCIFHNQTTNPILSIESMVGCCHVCGYGCADGFPNYAWAWLAGQKGAPYGIVTGGPQNDTSFCSKYTVPKCNHYETKNDTLPSCESGPPHKTPSCPARCDADSTYKTPFAQDVHRFSQAYAVAADEETIMREIMAHGPVTAGFNVYSDWIHYPEGAGPDQIYKPAGGTEMGGHAVRIVGWGASPAGVKYWTIANSFGTKWGIDGGYFKMARGVGAGGIEESVVAGLP